MNEDAKIKILFGSWSNENWTRGGQDGRIYSTEGICPTLDLQAFKRPLIVITNESDTD